MKKGISIWAFSGGTYAENFDLVKRFGFDGVELSLDAEGETSLQSTEKEILSVKQSAQDAGIELYSMATGLYWQYSLTSNDESVRKKAKDIVKKQIETAAILDCNTILVVPGATGVDFAPSLGVTDYDTAYQRAQDALCDLASFAESHKVAIGIENVWNKFLLSPLEMKQFIDEIDNPFVGSYFDVGNVLVNGYPEHWINILGSRIKKVHFKDFKRSIGTIDGFCDLLAGDVNYPAVMDAFNSIGYDDWVTAEVSPYPANNEVMLMHTSMAMDKILRRG